MFISLIYEQLNLYLKTKNLNSFGDDSSGVDHFLGDISNLLHALGHFGSNTISGLDDAGCFRGSHILGDGFLGSGDHGFNDIPGHELGVFLDFQGNFLEWATLTDDPFNSFLDELDQFVNTVSAGQSLGYILNGVQNVGDESRGIGVDDGGCLCGLFGGSSVLAHGQNNEGVEDFCLTNNKTELYYNCGFGLGYYGAYHCCK